MSLHYRVKPNPNLEFIYPVSSLCQAEAVRESMSLFHLTEIDGNMLLVEVSSDEGKTWTDIESC